MGDACRNVELIIASPGCEPKVMKYSCGPDLKSLINAVTALKDALFSHMKESNNSQNCGNPATLDEDDGEEDDEDDDEKPVIKKKRLKTS